MKLFRALGLGKDPLLEWCVTNFNMKVEKEEIDSSVADDGPPRWFWKGTWRERRVVIPTGPTSNKYDFVGPHLSIYIGDAGAVLDLGLYRPHDDDADDEQDRVLVGEFAIDPEGNGELLGPSLLSGLKRIVPQLSAGVAVVSVSRPGFSISFERTYDVSRIPSDLDSAQRICDLVVSAT
jgi:hypothetical protein